MVTGTLEYFVSCLLESLFGRRWWDYTGWPLNINGRICIISVMMFGLGSVALIKCIAPFTFGMIDGMSDIAVYALAVIIAFVMLVDSVKSVRNMDTDKLWYVEKQSEVVEEFENSAVMQKIKSVLRR